VGDQDLHLVLLDGTQTTCVAVTVPRIVPEHDLYDPPPFQCLNLVCMCMVASSALHSSVMKEMGIQLQCDWS